MGVALLLVWIITNFYCTSRNDVHPTDDFESYPNICDSLKRKWLYGKLNEIFNLSAGTKDPLEIRIWPLGVFDCQRCVFVFKIDTAGWHGYHYFSYTLPLGDQEGKKVTFSDTQKVGDSAFLVKEMVPVCGWKKFSDSLHFFSIRNLPTQPLIKNFKYKPVLDGGDISIEIATPKSYRFILYNNPEIYSYDECKKITGFMEMLGRQLGSNYSWPVSLLNNKKISYRN
jgi:hypothetical protein